MRRVCTPRWLVVHAGMLIVVVGFLLLGWWQVRRALDGNLLSFGYAVQWPVFAGFVVFVWLTEVRKVWPGQPPGEAGAAKTGNEVGGASHLGGGDGVPARARRVREGPAYDDSTDAELAAYNRYLAWLNANPHASPRDYPREYPRDYPGAVASPDPTGVPAGPVSPSREE